MLCRSAALALAAAALVGCAGTSSFEQCVQHSVGEGVERDRAEAACEDAVGRE
ncbi:MAG: hypothetical protein ACLGIG_05190 [Actinomycetes bacterium]